MMNAFNVNANSKILMLITVKNSCQCCNSLHVFMSPKLTLDWSKLLNVVYCRDRFDLPVYLSRV